MSMWKGPPVGPRSVPSLPPPALVPLTIEQVFEPLGPIPWVSEALSLAPGAPGMLAGYGGRGKSWLAQALAVATATGKPLGGLLDVKTGKVVYLDYEQASREARSRFQRIARAQDLTPQDFGDRLAPYISPPLRMNESNAESSMKRICDGATLCVIDSLSACITGIDENSSSMREPLDMMTRVSEATGCAFMVLHHTRKPPADQSKGYDKEMSVRGSSGIHAACSTIWQLDGSPGGASVLQHVKSRASKLRDSLALAITDVKGYRDDPAFGGVLVSLATMPKASGSIATSTIYERMAGPIMAFVLANPGCSQGTMRASMGGKTTHISDTIHALLEQGKLVNFGGSKSGAAMALHVVDVPAQVETEPEDSELF